MRPTRPLTRRLAVLGATALAAGALATVRMPEAAAATAVSVSVDATQTRATIPATAFGMNAAVYDSHMNDPAISGLMHDAGIGAMRYPGGSFADIYHWQTNTADNGGYVAPGTDFDTFMTTVRGASAQPVIIANYGSGTATEAANWVRYANVTKGYGAKYWEIGNEVYGNGYYGSQWENDTHADKSPTAYANNVLQYISAMKAVDSTIKVGVVLTTPGGWPDSVVHSGDSADWNHTVMSIVGGRADFVVIHWYPGGTNEADLLTKPSQIAGVVSTVRGIVNQYAGTNAANVGIAVTETNSTIDKDTHPAALFAPDTYLTWVENGVFNVDWWNLHNGSGSTSTVDGATDYNDEGVLSNASTGEPAANAPFAPYHGIQLMTKLGAPGDRLVGATSNRTLVSTHAVRRANGDLDVMIINKDPANAATVTLNYTGFTPATGTPTVWSYGLNGTTLTSAAAGSATSQTVPAYGMALVQLHQSSGGGGGGGDTTAPSTPQNLTASNITASGATLSWSASTDNVGVTGYDVFQAQGTGASRQVATVTGTSYPATGLAASTGYQFSVRARDAAGNVSANSATVSVTTPASGGGGGGGGGTGGTCSVTYTKNEWGGGVTASVTIANTGTAALNGWTLTFTFPGDTTVTSAWNATVTQSGAAVTARNAAYNGTIAAGANVSFGFQGAWAASDASPTAYSLNGTACTAH
jgi:hypothetical protein